MIIETEDNQSLSNSLLSEKKDSKTTKPNDLLLEKLECAFHKQTSTVILHDLAKIASEHSPIDLAYAAPRLPSGARPVLYENLSKIADKITFMVNTDSNTRIAIFREISDEEVQKLIQNMPPDEAVEVLEDLSERRFRKVMDILEPNKARRIKEIKKHSRNTAGRLMTNEFFAFQMDVSIGEAASYIRDNPGVDLTRRIFVVGAKGEILGYVPARNFIVNLPTLPMRQIMRPILNKVTAETSREEVVEIVEKYKISALPVVDAQDCLIGVITYEDVLDAFEDIMDETISSMAGTTENINAFEPLFKRFLSRSPWLLVTLFAGLVNFTVMSTFEKYEIGLLTFALFFVPLITGMSGNIGLQCSTILMRHMTLGFLSPTHRKEAIFKELAIGIFTGMVFGILCGVIVYFLNLVGISGITASPLAVGLIVSCGLFGACVTGTVLGVLSPLFFSRIGIDPAVASGPIVTAFNDFLSMSIYFLIAVGLSQLIF